MEVEHAKAIPAPFDGRVVEFGFYMQDPGVKAKLAHNSEQINAERIPFLRG